MFYSVTIYVMWWKLIVLAHWSWEEGKPVCCQLFCTMNCIWLCTMAYVTLNKNPITIAIPTAIHSVNCYCNYHCHRRHHHYHHHYYCDTDMLKNYQMCSQRIFYKKLWFPSLVSAVKYCINFIEFKFGSVSVYLSDEYFCSILLTHFPLHKMAAISQTTFSHAFSWIKSFVFWFKFHWSLFLRVQLTISQHWFRQWLGVDQATNHYLNQCWPS